MALLVRLRYFSAAAVHWPAKASKVAASPSRAMKRRFIAAFLKKLVSKRGRSSIQTGRTKDTVQRVATGMVADSPPIVMTSGMADPKQWKASRF
jgi:hypothetical protein